VVVPENEDLAMGRRQLRYRSPDVPLQLSVLCLVDRIIRTSRDFGAALLEKGVERLMATQAFSAREIAYPVADDLIEPRVDRAINIESVQIRKEFEDAVLCDVECGISVAGQLEGKDVRRSAYAPTQSFPSSEISVPSRYDHLLVRQSGAHRCDHICYYARDLLLFAPFFSGACFDW